MITKDVIVSGINNAVVKRDSLNLDDYIKAAKEKYAPYSDAEKNVINTAYDKSRSNAKAANEKSVWDTNVDYAGQYERNAVQKLINEKQVAEKMSNLGLTDSGLNRSQQTAVQMGYANQKGKLDLAKQNALDNLALNLSSALSEIEINRNSDILISDQKWDEKIYTEAQNNYNNDVATYNAQIASGYEELGKLEESENKYINADKQKIYWFRGVSDETGNYLYYNTETGKTEEIPAYMNPYTSNDNRIAYSAEYNDKNIGFFQLADGTPGYQPRGLVSEGGKFTKATVDDGVVKYDLYNNGKKNTIWKSKSQKFFIWDDLNNRYLDLTDEIKEIYPNIK